MNQNKAMERLNELMEDELVTTVIIKENLEIEDIIIKAGTEMKLRFGVEDMWPVLISKVNGNEWGYEYGEPSNFSKHIKFI